MSIKQPQLTMKDTDAAAYRLRIEREFQERFTHLRRKYAHLLRPRIQGRPK